MTNLVPKTKVGSHVDALADKLKEAHKEVRGLNKIGRVKQKAYYDKNTTLVSYTVGEYVYLKEMAVGAGKSKSSAADCVELISLSNNF
jgi:hypothetical protein